VTNAQGHVLYYSNPGFKSWTDTLRCDANYMTEIILVCIQMNSFKLFRNFVLYIIQTLPGCVM